MLGKFHGQRSLVGFNPWGCKELDTTQNIQHNKTQPRMCLLWPHCADPRQLEEEAPPPDFGLAVSPGSLPSDSCRLPVPPGSQGHVQKAPSEAGLAPGCPLGWQRMEPVGSAS